MTMDVQITRATADDASSAMPLLLAQFAEHDIRRSHREADEALRGMLADARWGTVLLARVPASAPSPSPAPSPVAVTVGLAVLPYLWTLEHGGLVAWLDELYVVPARRGQGIGRALLLAGIDAVRGDGCRALELEVEADHLRAARLYQREGFERLTRTRYSLDLVTRPAAAIDPSDAKQGPTA